MIDVLALVVVVDQNAHQGDGALEGHRTDVPAVFLLFAGDIHRSCLAAAGYDAVSTQLHGEPAVNTILCQTLVCGLGGDIVGTDYPPAWARAFLITSVAPYAIGCIGIPSVFELGESSVAISKEGGQDGIKVCIVVHCDTFLGFPFS